MNPLFTLLFAALSLSNGGDRPKGEALSYIQLYKDLAVIEMHRTGVPASITMAQALLESHMGKSDLALNSNNHFGIKCKENWTGSTYYHKDDDTDHSGNLIPSCFRAYQNVMDSYVDHSNFIKYRGYYAHLMILDKNDYKSWAWGLQKAGYATDKGYASKLINYIEIYDLNSLNDLSDPRDILR